MADHAEQLRPPIVRGEGVTASERYLAKLGDRSFLNLWSYSSPYRDKMAGGQTTGKELCDLLVVCGPHIIIFSEKTIAWQADKDVTIAWPRWFRAAVWESVKQIRGAERWINQFPDRIFLDAECKTPLPLALPPVGERIIHRVVVAQGVTEAVRKHFGGGNGSLVIKPAIVGDQHFDTHIHGHSVEPFAVGDIDPAEPFVHILDEASLDVVMGELDTITDFTDYLQKKEALIRSGRLARAASEQDLLAYYAIRINDDGDHDFTPPTGGQWAAGQTLDVPGGGWAKFEDDPQYQARKLANRDSYLWDRLITAFTDNMLKGTSIVLDGSEYNLKESEAGVRFMALEGRFRRRALGKAVLGAMQEGMKGDKFFRAMVGKEGGPNSDTGFFFLTMARKDFMEEGGYDEYRQFRMLHASTYAQAMLMRNPYLKRIVGIATEPPGQGRGSSEDFVMMEQDNWTDEQRAQVADLCKNLNIMQSAMKEWHNNEPEFPEGDWIRIVAGDRSITFMDPPDGSDSWNEDPFAEMADLMNGRASRGERDLITDWEDWWSNTIVVWLQAMSISRPGAMLDDCDYRFFDRFLMKKLPDYIREFSPDIGAKIDERKGAGVDLQLMFREDFRFSSAAEPGLELVDIVTNALRRALVGNLRPEGWMPLRSLMINRRDGCVRPVSLHFEDRVLSRSYSEVLHHFRVGGRNMTTRE